MDLYDIATQKLDTRMLSASAVDHTYHGHDQQQDKPCISNSTFVPDGGDQNGTRLESTSEVTTTRVPLTVPLIIELGFKNYQMKVVNGRGKVTSAKCRFCDKRESEDGSTTSNYIRHIQRKHKAVHADYLSRRSKTKVEKGLALDPAHRKSKARAEKDLALDPAHTKYKARAEKVSILKPADGKSKARVEKSLVLDPTHGKSSKKYRLRDSQQNSLVQKVVDLIIGCNLPLSFVEQPDFLALLETLNPRFSPPSRLTVSAMIDERCAEVKAALREAIRNQEIAVTLYIWRDHAMRSFLGISGHHIQGKTLTSSLLACCHLTGADILKAYQSAIAEYDAKVSYAITYNTSVMKRAFDIDIRPGEMEALAEEGRPVVDRNGLDLGSTETKRLSCFAYSLQLCIGDGLKENKRMNSALEKISEMSSLLHASEKFKEVFDALFTGDGEGVGTPHPRVMRWNNSLRRIKAVLKLTQTGINTFLDRNDHPDLKLNHKEWAHLEELKALLSPFAEATDQTQGNKVFTISLVLPIILALEDHLLSIGPTLRHLKPVKDKLKASLHSRFRGIFNRLDLETYDEKVPFSDDVYILSTVLDPNWCLSWIETWRKDGNEDISALVRDLVIRHAPTNAELSTSQTHNDEDEDCEGSLFASVKRLRSTPSTTIEQYHQYTSGLRDQAGTGTVCPFEFWAQTGIRYPSLAKLALRLLTVPATLAPVERIFSQGGPILEPRRTCLSDDNLSKLVFLKCNK